MVSKSVAGWRTFVRYLTGQGMAPRHKGHSTRRILAPTFASFASIFS